uniref:Uncharacterized protein n=1 Tax=viral metagenome TaxID=1070528 RepID=A0A6C0KBT3_9ZZZZ
MLLKLNKIITYKISYKHPNMEFTTDLLCFSYACSTQNPDMIEKLRCSNKILLPESMLFELTKDNHNSLEQKLYFKVSNNETQYGEVCGVHEFSAPPGVVYLPYHIMESCALQEGNTVKVDLVSPPKGNFMKIRLHNSKEFSKLTNPKVVLEKIISRDYPVVTQGQTIALNYTDLNKVFMIDIVEARPSEIIEIINTDINVDFDKALDYEESPPKKQEVKEAWIPPMNQNVKINHDISGSTIHQNRNLKQFKKTEGFVPFSGKGNVLGRK